MSIIFLIIILWQGDIRYKVIELPSWSECRELKVAEEAWVASQKAQLIRSECFEVGRVVSK